MSPKHSSELLAPAGSAEAAWAALAYGADAVYAGLPRFSARAEAVNFSTEQLDELIGYAHTKGKKVYLTFNTLVQQQELPDALESLAQINDLHADGVIVQDMGVARMTQRFFPNLELHASTQLAVHNPDGAKLLADIGFSRVVLARELSLNEIAEITSTCGIETEVFIHGALCYSYSGLCLFSSHLLSRSGNRGRCAYCCRQTYEENSERKLPFSMKDFAVGEHFNRLLDTGVASLKIEGRMKGAAYVGAVTDFYRKRMDEGLSEIEQQELLSDIQTIFGRPSTDLFLEKKDTDPIDPTTNGHRGAVIGTVKGIRNDRGAHWLQFETGRALQKYDGLKIEIPGEKEPYGFSATEIRFQNDRKKHLKFEVPAGSTIEVKLPAGHPYLEPGLTIYCSISQEVRQRYGFETPRPGTYRQRKPVDVSVELTAGCIQLTAQGAGAYAELNISEQLSEARQPEKTPAAIRKAFEKTGDTEWELAELTAIDNGLFAPASMLNNARRELLEKLSEELSTQKQAQHFERLQDLVQTPATPGETEHWTLKLRDLSLLDGLTEEELARFDEIVLENVDEASCLVAVEKTNARNEAESIVYNIRTAIPVIQRNHDSRITDHATPVEVANVGALKKYADSPNLTADWPLYTLNTEAAAQWQELGIQQMVLSPEDTGDNLKALIEILGDRAIIPIYQHTPLMISAAKPDSGATLNDRDKRTLQITEYGELHILTLDDPFCLIEHIGELRAIGARNFRIDLSFGVERAEQATKIIRDSLSAKPIPGSYDGNYCKTL